MKAAQKIKMISIKNHNYIMHLRMTPGGWRANAGLGGPGRACGCVRNVNCIIGEWWSETNGDFQSMNLSVALSLSRQNLNKEVSGLRLRHDPTMAYWCDELGIDASASQLATEKLIKNLAPNNNQRVVSLLESLRRELAQIASLAGSMSQKLETA